MPHPKPPISRDRALELAREVSSGKARSYVSAAIALSEFVLSLEHPPPALPIAIEPDPFPAPATPAPHARRFLSPGEHRFVDLPHPYRTNRPPEPDDARAMRSPLPPLPQVNTPITEEALELYAEPDPFVDRECETPVPGAADELVSAPKLRISDRPEPYGPSPSFADVTVPPPDSSRKATQPSMRSPVPHPPDSSSTLVFDFSPSATPPLPPPSARAYCGLCDHEHCICPDETVVMRVPVPPSPVPRFDPEPEGNE